MSDYFSIGFPHGVINVASDKTLRKQAFLEALTLFVLFRRSPRSPSGPAALLARCGSGATDRPEGVRPDPCPLQRPFHSHQVHRRS